MVEIKLNEHDLPEELALDVIILEAIPIETAQGRGYELKAVEKVFSHIKFHTYEAWINQATYGMQYKGIDYRLYITPDTLHLIIFTDYVPHVNAYPPEAWRGEA